MERFSEKMAIRAVVEELVLAKATPVEDATDDGFDKSMYLQTVFGYIALKGTSKKTVHYGEVDIIGPKANKKLGVDSRGKVNIGEMVIRMRALAAAVSEGPVKGATLRQMCEPFAEEAYLCLVKLAELGVYSQLASKMTRIGNREPQVMFDFAAGLNLLNLTRSEATVVQAMHSRLFRTEGAKGVFEAQSSVGEQGVEV
nr:coat protein [Allamanda chlorotic virus B]